jgi:hypothetical protein
LVLVSGCQGSGSTSSVSSTGVAATGPGSSSGGVSGGLSTGGSSSSSAGSTGTSGGSSTGFATTSGTTSGSSTGGLRGSVTTIAGGGNGGGNCLAYGAESSFQPTGIAVDSYGGILVANGDLDDVENDGGLSIDVISEDFGGVAVGASNSIFVSTGFEVDQVVGTTVVHLAGGAPGCGDTGSDAGVGFNDVAALAVGPDGYIYVADTGVEFQSLCNRIRKIAPDGITTTLSGEGLASFNDGPPGTAGFQIPSGIAVDNAGYVYVGDAFNGRIRKVAPDGTATTLAGGYTEGFDDGPGGPQGTATFGNPRGVVLDAQGNLYVVDNGNYAIRKVAPDGTTTTIAGTGVSGYVDGTLGRNGTTQFIDPTGIALGADGEIYVADDCYIRVIRFDQ